MINGFNDIVKIYEENGQLSRLAETVSYSEIEDYVGKEMMEENGGKAILFENSGIYPVLANLAGNDFRCSILLSGDTKGRLESLKDTLSRPSYTIRDIIAVLSLAKNILKWIPRRAKAPFKCQEAIKFITKFTDITNSSVLDYALVSTADPTTGAMVIEHCRVCIESDTTARIGFREGGHSAANCEKTSYRVPAAICIGGDPAYYVAASLKVPDYIDRYAVAGFLRNKRVRLAKCLTQKILVPEETDMVLEGYIQKSDGLFHLTGISHRKDAVLPYSLSRSTIESLIKKNW